MNKITIDGNSAMSHIAYLMNDMAIIYPITPSSPMAENCDDLATKGVTNIFNHPVKITQMQSEAGVAGALHGALSSGALATTFTSSQGLLLMLPNMYKIAGELLPCVMYVASRSLATHALNIFCDHSDIYSCLNTGFNIISCSSVQEANDIAIAAQLASLNCSLPFICFFDGFRTSHELNTIEQSTKEEIASIINVDDIKKFKSRAMSCYKPYAKGTNQNPDVFFQNRMASAPFYNNVINSVKSALQKTATITNRTYDTIEYYGDKDASDIIVAMGSSIHTIKQAMPYLKGKIGLINIRLLQPFDEQTFIKLLPKTVKNITVLERNYNANGSNPIYSMIINTLFKNKIKINVLQGVYGLGGKEFTPDDAISVYYNMRDKQLSPFTVGINDDVNNNSLLPIKLYEEPTSDFNARIYGLGSDGSVSSAKSVIKILGQNSYAQGYFDYDSKKSGSLTISHIRSSKQPINKPFNSQHVDVVLCNNQSFLKKYNVASCLHNKGILIINCKYNENQLNDIMLNETKQAILDKNIKVYTLNADEIALKNNLGNKINNIMQASLFYATKVIPYTKALDNIKTNIEVMFAKKGEEVVNNNIKAISSVQKGIKAINNSVFIITEDVKAEPKTEYYENVIKPITKQLGNEIPVSKFKPDGSMPNDTSKFEKRGVASSIPCWQAEKCIQCGRCSVVCPHASLRPVVFEPNDKTPSSFTSKRALLTEGEYRMQIEPLDCTGCGVCSQICPTKAITMNSDSKLKEIELKNQAYASTLPQVLPFEPNSIKGIQFKKPYFEFSGACAGCGETPYIKLLTQLFGDRMMIANATGCSSIYGGTFPTCPYTKDALDLGPAWANSLFEDNAEFGYGIMLARSEQRNNFITTLKQTKFSKDIQDIISKFLKSPDNHEQNREILQQLTLYSATRGVADSDKYLFENIGLIIKPSPWIIGGDGWAYDIGFGGLDHVMASGENINVLVLDTEVYSNTGGQTSKSTPRGASAKFNQMGKTTKKKDLASMMMSYGNVYVAQVAFGANPDQTLRAFMEAEAHNGPSIIIAYSPCVNHGYDLQYAQAHSNNSVSSGYNTLFRYNPNLKPCMQVDSIEPYTEYEDYVNTENRYKVLDKVNPTNKAKLIKQSKQDATLRRKNYTALSKRK